MISMCSALITACTTEDEAPPETLMVSVETPTGVVQVEATIRDGLAIVDDDIVLGSEDDARVAEVSNLRSAGRNLTTYRWPNGVVPYELDPTYDSDQRQAILDAMREWYLITPYRFVIHTNEPDYVYFLNDSANNSSSIGRHGGKQYIRVAGRRPGLIEHEIGHALGLWHEQQRADRDNYVTVHLENVLPDKVPNFQTYVQQGTDGRDLFPYDINSIMHYGSYAFSANTKPTITRKDGSTFDEQRDAPTDEDVGGAVRVLTYTDGQQTYTNVNGATGRCLDVQAASYTRGAPINNYTCHGGDNQRWIWWWIPWNGSYLLINQRSGMCLDTSAFVSGTRVAQQPCDGSLGERWDLSDGRLHSASSPSWCVQAKSDWTATIEPCDGGTDQKWAFNY
ncbi:MAG TPA: M12 family metallopeptidase [Kofleriaceae bacterium]|nr:M12 family metallopeptidase [Kofleriaceae bacterium]